jgi:hypothetical protein
VSKASSTIALLFSAFESFTVMSAFPRGCWLLIAEAGVCPGGYVEMGLAPSGDDDLIA